MEKIQDGQHRHGKIITKWNAKFLKLASEHIKKCKELPAVINRSTQVPFHFKTQSGKTVAYCGFCKKELGECKMED